MFVMHDRPSTSIFMWRATIASGTVDIPTASAPIVQLQAQPLGPDTVDDVHHARQLMQLHRQRLRLAIAVAPRRGGGIDPEADGVEAKRPRLVADHFHPAVLLADEERLEVRRQRAELGLAAFGDIDDRDREPPRIRCIQ